MNDDVVHGELVPAPLTGRIELAMQIAAATDPDEVYSAAARELIDEGVAKNTRIAMLKCAFRYVKWCGETGRQHIPATPATVIEFILYLGRQPGRYNGRDVDGTEMPFRSLAPETVRMHLKMIARAHRLIRRPENDASGRPFYGYESPTRHPDVQAALRAYCKRWAAAGHRPDTASDLTPEEFSQMLATFPDEGPRAAHNKALLALTYDAGLRKEEPFSILIEDLTFTTSVDGWPVLRFLLPYSKTDQSAQGAEVIVHQHPPEDAATCPVRLVRAWLAELKAAGFTSGLLFRKVLGGGPAKADGTPAACTIVDRPGTGHTLEYIVRKAGLAAGLIDTSVPRRKQRHLVVHSLRAGSATAAAEAGADTPELNLHYRWSPNAPTANRYANRGKRRRRTNPSRRIWVARSQELSESEGGAAG